MGSDQKELSRGQNLTTSLDYYTSNLTIQNPTNISFYYGINGPAYPSTPWQLIVWVIKPQADGHIDPEILPSDCQSADDQNYSPEYPRRHDTALMERGPSSLTTRGNPSCMFPTVNTCGAGNSTTMITLEAGAYVLHWSRIGDSLMPCKPVFPSLFRKRNPRQELSTCRV